GWQRGGLMKSKIQAAKSRLTTRARGGASATRNYLSYDPWRGDLNNTRMCLETVLVLASLLDRTLVFPTKAYEPLVGGYSPPNPLEVFDLADLRKITPILLDRDLSSSELQLLRDERETFNLEIDVQTDVFCYPSMPRPRSKRYAMLRRFTAHRSR